MIHREYKIGLKYITFLGLTIILVLSNCYQSNVNETELKQYYTFNYFHNNKLIQKADFTSYLNNEQNKAVEYFKMCLKSELSICEEAYVKLRLNEISYEYDFIDYKNNLIITDLCNDAFVKYKSYIQKKYTNYNNLQIDSLNYYYELLQKEYANNSHPISNLLLNKLEYSTFVTLNVIESDMFATNIENSFKLNNNHTQDYFWFLYLKCYTNFYSANYSQAEESIKVFNDKNNFTFPLNKYQNYVVKFLDMNVNSRLEVKDTLGTKYKNLIKDTKINKNNRLYQNIISTEIFNNFKENNSTEALHNIKLLKSNNLDNIPFLDSNIFHGLYCNKYATNSEAYRYFYKFIKNIPNSQLRNKYEQLALYNLMDINIQTNNIDSALTYHKKYEQTLSSNVHKNKIDYSKISDLDTIVLSKLDGYNQAARIYLKDFEVNTNIESCIQSKYLSETSLENLYTWSNSLYFQDYIHLAKGKKNNAISTALMSNYYLFNNTRDSMYLNDFIKIMSRNSGDHLTIQKKYGVELKNLKKDLIGKYESELNNKFSKEFMNRIRGLKNNQRFVAFDLIGSKLFTLICSNNEISIHKSKINKDSLLAFSKIQNDPSSKFKQSNFTKYVSKALLENWYDKSITKVYINRKDILQDISFECLTSDPTQDYLIKNTEVSYISQIENFSPQKPKINSSTKIHGFSFSENDKNKWRYDLPFPELEGSVEELNEIVKYCKNHSVTYGQECSREAIFNKLGQEKTIVHFALHGHSNPVQLDDNFLLIKQDDKIDSIKAFQLLDHDVKSDLVVLSACHSSVGKYIKGEGKYTLKRIFEIMGAKNTISSLWELDDQSGLSIFSTFYELICNHSMDYSNNLRQSKLKLINNDKFSHPYYWASLTYETN